MPGYYDSQVESAESNYRASISKLNNIRQSNYVYYTTEYRTEKSRHVSGWKWTHYKTRQVPYQVQHVNHAQYNHDKAEAGRDLANKKSAARSAYNSAISAKDSEIRSLHSSLSSTSKSLELAKLENIRLLNLKKEAEARVSASQMRVNILKEELEKEEIETARLDLIYKEAKDKCEEARDYNDDLHKQVDGRVTSASDQERAELFFSFYQDKHVEEIKEQILSEGIDLTYIAYRAIERGREDLLDYAINRGISFDESEVHVSSTSLFLYALKKDSCFLDKIIANTDSFDNSINILMMNDDVELMDKLLEKKPELTEVFVNHFNLLHESIFYHATGIFHTLLIEHPELIEQKTLDNISTFYLALESKENYFAEQIGRNVNIQEEINIILESFRIKEKLSKMEKVVELFPEEITASLIHSLLLDESKENIVSMLIERYPGNREDLSRDILELSSLERLEEEDVLSNIALESRGNSHNEDMLDYMDFHVDYNDM